MLDQFVPYRLMQFQKLKHGVTRYFDTKSSEKRKQIQRQPGPFIQMQIYVALYMYSNTLG